MTTNAEREVLVTFIENMGITDDYKYTLLQYFHAVSGKVDGNDLHFFQNQ